MFERAPNGFFTHDLIVFNQPFAPATDGEQLCGCGFDGGYEISRRFLLEARGRLMPGGRIVMPFSDRAPPENDPALVANELGYDTRTLLHAYYEEANNFIYEMRPSS